MIEIDMRRVTMQKVCNLLKYNCIKCSKTTALEIRVKIQGRTLDLFRDMFDGKLCLSCMTGTDKAVEGAAENIMALLN